MFKILEEYLMVIGNFLATESDEQAKLELFLRDKTMMSQHDLDYWIKVYNRTHHYY